jgi:DNA topoisomerase-1
MKYCDIQKLSATTRADKWWEKMEKKEGSKWDTLKHNGVLFPPPYEPLPSRIKILHKGEPLSLDSKSTKNPFNITAEEAAVFFAMKMEQDDRLADKSSHRKKSIDDKKFTDNFWKDWKKILGSSHPIKSFKDVDFTPIQKFIAKRSEEKKSTKKSKEEKDDEKKKKEDLRDLYGYAIVDEVKIPLGNYMVQPPGLYIGHGTHPLRGKIKKRIEPQDITLNISKTNIPKCIINGIPCKWGDIIQNHDVTWIASWRHPITEEMNYVWLKREASEWVCASDIQKFDKARNLAKNIEKVRRKYTEDLSSKNKQTRQLATAVYLLDVLAIRPGTEKDESKEAGTLGLTTLKCSNIKFGSDNKITVDFIGKSSIQFNKKFKVSETVYKNLESLCEKGTELFPDVNATTLNEYLKTLLPDLTAKVFRTYKASSILEKELDKNIPKESDPVHEKKLAYDRVNIEVAKALNHKKMGGSDTRVEKLKEKITELKEKKSKSKTPKQKQTVQKSIDINTAKLEEAQFNISTSTSKVNYLDPRIVVAWCKKGDVPIEKIYNKTQLTKFVWAMETPLQWKF